MIFVYVRLVAWKKIQSKEIFKIIPAAQIYNFTLKQRKWQENKRGCTTKPQHDLPVIGPTTPYHLFLFPLK